MFYGDNMSLDNNLSDVIFDNVNIVDVVSDYVGLKRTGKNYKGLCPFHSEKTPSFIVSEDKQLFHCFGCGAAGNSIQFIMRIENFDFLDAVEFIADKYNIDLSQYKKSKKSNINVNRDERSRFLEIMRDAALFYYNNLKSNEISKNYLLNRGITENTMKKFGVGYALPGWDNLLKGMKNVNPEELEKVGLVIKRNDKTGYYDRFRERIIFPIIDVRGKVIGFGGRVLDDSLPKYLNSPETALFDKSKTLFGLNIAKNHIEENNKTIIVTEGYMDVISLHNVGVRNAVATLGTALTAEHGRILERYADVIIICYDSDDAGIKATSRSIQVLKNLKSKIKILQLGEKLDPDEYIKKYGKEKFLAEALMAKPSYEYELEALKDNYDLSISDDQYEFIKKAVEIFGDLSDNIKVEYFISVMSKIQFINENHVRNVLKNLNFKIKPEYGKPRGFKTIKKKSAFSVLEERLVFLSFGDKKRFDFIKSNLKFSDIVDEKVFRYMVVFDEICKKFSTFDLADLSELMEVSELVELERILRMGIPYEEFEKEAQFAICNHEILIMENEIKEIKTERDKYLKLLNSGSDIERDKVVKICTELTKKDKELHAELKNRRYKLSNWKGGKLVEQ